MRLPALAVAACAAGALGVAACGGGAGSPAPARTTPVVHLYSSMPLQGPEREHGAAVVKGIRLALDQVDGRAGSVAVQYTSLDDSTFKQGGWDPDRTAHDARRVEHDAQAVGYIGDFDSAATEVSLPILNRGGVAQVSPASTYVGLTQKVPGTAADEPARYAPSGKRSFLRILPTDTVQAGALVLTMTTPQKDRCKRAGIADDGTPYGRSLAGLVVRRASRAKMKITAHHMTGMAAADRHALVSALVHEKADCFLMVSASTGDAVKVYESVGSALPHARLYGPDALCQPGVTDPAETGLPASLGKRYTCTSPALPPDYYLGGKQFLADYRAQYAGAPDPYAIYGYEVARLFVDTIAALGRDGTSREAVRSTLFATRDRPSPVLGVYSFDRRGDTSITDYGVYRAGPDGSPRFVAVVKPG